MNNIDSSTIKAWLFFVLITFTGIFATAQGNYTHLEDEIDFSTISPTLSSIDRVKGWALQDNGAWMSEMNRIPLSFENKVKPRTPKEKLGQDNIISLELRRVMVGREQYMALVHIYKDGLYEFPILQEDWTQFKSFEFYVFKSFKTF